MISVRWSHLEKTFGKGDSQSTREKDVAPTRTNLMVMIKVMLLMVMLKVMTKVMPMEMLVVKLMEMLIAYDNDDNDDLPERRTISGPPESPVHVVSRPGRWSSWWRQWCWWWSWWCWWWQAWWHSKSFRQSWSWLWWYWLLTCWTPKCADHLFCDLARHQFV